MNLKDQLVQILSDLSSVAQESSLILGALILLVTGLIFTNEALLKCIFILSLGIASYYSLKVSSFGFILSNSLEISHLNSKFSQLLIGSTVLLVLFQRKKQITEFYFLILSLLVGSLFMIKANSLLMVYLSVELVSYASYILSGFSFTKRGNESAIKYLLFGGVSSAILLIGLGLVYGSTGSFYLSILDASLFNSALSQTGLLFVIFGIFFKASIFPFHIWTPAVYQSAPVDAVAIFSVVPKLSGLILLHNFLSHIQLSTDHWIVEVIILMGMMTVITGTLGAIKQSDTRRMIAFGSIGHSGFLFVFVISNQLLMDAFWFYSLTYAIMSMGAFYIIHCFEANSIERNSQYAFINNQVLMLVSFTFILISLVGIPPLSGFTAKFFLFSYLWDWYQSSQSHLVLSYLLISVFATVAALFYYLRIPYFYFLQSNIMKKEVKSTEIALSAKIIATLFGVILLLLFFVPQLVV
ncbi:MAG: NADH-quinone oxidoreductase subunit N [Ekhidna sp.]|nr:NADH-quinone oxidoreductase subunit N [Ekhidna sp.]MBC6410430.1 NADH-quinone oxidoreductase subunit N [Ekhidna sp.]